MQYGMGEFPIMFATSSERDIEERGTGLLFFRTDT